jgi:Flp pilus assembly protein TadD
MATVAEALAQGWQYQRAGRLDVAEQVYRNILDVQPDQPDALYLLGTVCHRQGKLDDAVQHLLMAVSVRPDFSEAHNNLGVVMATMGHRLDAVKHFRHVVRLKPNDPDASNNLGNALREQGELDEAVERLRYALRLRPDFADAMHNLGLTLHDQGKYEEAVAQLTLAVRLRPDFAEVYNDLGMICGKMKRWDEAAAHFQQLVRLRPDNADGLAHLGAVLREQGQLDESADRLRHAARLKPDDANILSNLGLTLQQAGQLREAKEHLRHAISVDPEHADAHNNLAVTFAQLGRFDEALGEYAEALRIRPQQAIYRRNRALSWLTLGDFEKGWPEYEFRWQCPGFVERKLKQPRWNGEPIENKTLLLYAEQGLGDTMQWIRYAPMVKQFGATVFVEVQPALMRLLSRVKGIDRLIAQGEMLPAFDYHIPLGSLPGVFQTTVETIPDEVPYLTAEEERVEYWQGQLASLPDLKIGIAWQGNPKQGGDRLRSIPLIHFAPLARLDGVQLISLQKEPGAEQLKEMADALPVIDLARRLDLSGGAFLDTAAVMRSLDMVITCDTAIGHLAGALGVPVWLALSAAADWRWLTDRDDTPWYPTMRLFRQNKLGRWDDVFERMAAEIKSRLSPAGNVNTQSVTIEISPGELIDKITILQIKNERVKDSAKLQNIRTELETLNAAREQSLPPAERIDSLTADLKQVNVAIWEAEDYLRACENVQKFDQDFIDIARSVYRNNDHRASLKRQINEFFSATFIEEKEHPHYR